MAEATRSALFQSNPITFLRFSMGYGNPLRAAIGSITRGRVLAIAAASVAIGVSSDALACYGLTCAPSVCSGLGVAMPHLGPGNDALKDNADIMVDWVNQSRNMRLLSNLPLSAIGGGAGSSLYGWVDPLTNHEYAIMG